MTGFCPACAGRKLGSTHELIEWVQRAERDRVRREAQPKPSHVRLDSLRHVFQLRAYATPIDATSPLEAMRQPYIVTGIVTVVSDTASVDMVIARSEITREALADLDDALRAMGVCRVIWERHRENGEVKQVERRIA